MKGGTEGTIGNAALVTGGERGIGRACVDALLEKGFSVFVAGWDEVALNKLAGEGLGDRVRVERIDIGSEDGPGRAVAECLSAFGRIDALVNVAACYDDVKTNEIEAADVYATLDTDLRGPILTAAAASRWMIENGGGRIVHFASTAVEYLLPGWSLYAVAKAGLIAHAKSMAVELGRYDIAVNTIAPGWTRTPLTAEWLETEPEKAMAGINPMQRHAEPEEIANVVAYLCADAPTFLNGENIIVDGGERAFGREPGRPQAG